MVNGETPYRAEIPNVQLGRPHMGLRPQMVNRETPYRAETPYGPLGDPMLG